MRPLEFSSSPQFVGQQPAQKDVENLAGFCAILILLYSLRMRLKR
jgi:hypothetical protein